MQANLGQKVATFCWLSSTAQHLFRSTAQLSRGVVPCPGPRLAAALRADASGAQCEGVLRHDATLRADLAAQIDDRFGGAAEISDATAPLLLDVFSEVLQARVEALRATDEPFGDLLPGRLMPLRELRWILSGRPGCAGEAGPTLEPELPTSGAVRRDWVLWHAAAPAGPELPEFVFRERLAIALGAADETCTAEVAMGAHTLQHALHYIAWEAAMAERALEQSPQPVRRPFTPAEHAEVAARRALTSVIPESVAAHAASRISAGEEPQSVFAEIAEIARRDARIPPYRAPKAQRTPQPKEKRRRTSEA